MKVASDLETARRHAATVQELNLRNAGLRELPDFVYAMPHLQILDLSGNLLDDSRLDFSRFPPLHSLSLERMALHEVPPGLTAQTQLQRLRLGGNPELYAITRNELPREQLRELTAEGCSLALWIPELCDFPKLETLVLNDNDFMGLPEKMAQMRSLRYLDLRNNSLIHLPSELARLPHLKQLLLKGNPMGILHDPRTTEAVSRLLEATADGKIPLDERLRLTQVLLQDLSGLLSRPPSELLSLLSTKFNTVRERAPSALYAALSDPFGPAPPATVCLLGRFQNLKRSAVKQSLQKRGIGVVSRPTGPDCVVIAGERPGDKLTVAQESGCPVGVEGHLEDFLNRAEGRFLTFAKGNDSAELNNLRGLLRSGDEGNIRLALNLMETGGMPADVLSDLVGIMSFHYHSGAQKLTRDFLNAHAPRRTLRFLDAIFQAYCEPDEGFDDPGKYFRLLAAHPELDQLVLLEHACRRSSWDHVTMPVVFALPRALQAPLVQQIVETNSESLRISNLALPEFPEALLSASGLHELIMSDNGLQKLPDRLGEMRHLTELDIYNNALTELPPSIAQIPNLERLRISGNRLTSLPDNLGEAQKLQRLNLRENPLRALPESMAQIPGLKSLVLDACFQEQGQLPPVVARVRSLKYLSLTDNHLTDLDDLDPDWPHLETLILAENQLQRLPRWIPDLPRLRRLNLRNNPIQELPEDLVRCQQLESIMLPRGRGLNYAEIGPLLLRLPHLMRVTYSRNAVAYGVALQLERVLRARGIILAYS